MVMLTLSGVNVDTWYGGICTFQSMIVGIIHLTLSRCFFPYSYDSDDGRYVPRCLVALAGATADDLYPHCRGHGKCLSRLRKMATAPAKSVATTALSRLKMYLGKHILVITPSGRATGFNVSQKRGYSIVHRI